MTVTTNTETPLFECNRCGFTYDQGRVGLGCSVCIKGVLVTFRPTLPVVPAAIVVDHRDGYVFSSTTAGKPFTATEAHLFAREHNTGLREPVYFVYSLTKEAYR